MTRLLVVMGSGETAPTMVKPHRAIFERLGDAPAILLDTPYGFQENAQDISHKAVGYFAASVGRTVTVANWPATPPPGLARERALDALRSAGWVFAGPGSPTYALRQWWGTPVPDLLAEKLSRSGVVVFASAAALTLGSHTVPVYEIYKAGEDPTWVPGLDLVNRLTGLPAVVIPHYDNAEGGHHDTRFCYLGERRLSTMEHLLPDESFILGVDEHTGVILDLDARTATVIGNGHLTLRRQGHSAVHASGSVLDFAQLAGLAGESTVEPTAVEASTEPENTGESLMAQADRIEAAFADAAGRRDLDGRVAAILELEQTLLDWAADTLTSDEGDRARATLRRMVLRLGESAGTPIDPFVEALLELRRRARAARDFDTSDWIRDQLVVAGVEVRDTGDGATWQLRTADSP